MINIFKSQTTQYVYIQGVEHSFAEDFEYVRSGNIFTIKTKFTDVVQVCEQPFTEFTGRDGALNEITFATANDFENYLISTFTQIPPAGGSTVYGSQLNIFKNDLVLINDTNIPQDVINANTAMLPAGTYEIDIVYSWNTNSTQSDIETYFFLDGIALGSNPTGLIHKQEPKDAAGNYMGTASSQQLAFQKKFITDIVIPGSKNIRLAFNTANAGKKASIFETLIKLKRIA